MRRTPTGVLNGNWRNRDYFFYAKAKEQPYTREQMERIMFKKKLRAAYWHQRFVNALDVLRTVDAQGWERWYDDDSNMPAEGTDQEYANLIEARVRELTDSYPVIKVTICRDIFIWHDDLGVFVYSKEVGKKPGYVLSFVSIEAAKEFINGLPLTNCGYGFVLDLLPSPIMATSQVESE